MRETSPETALAMKEAYDAVSPFIEKHTGRVCPSCRRVCCIDRHATHEAEDLAFLKAIGESPPPAPPLEEETAPCRHLSVNGCLIPRWLRPFRCTWYFCPSLLEEMPLENPREYREFVRALRRLQEFRRLVAGAG